MKKYTGRNLDQIAFPLGGIGAGMLCLQGTGSFGAVSLWNKPDLANDPFMFSAITLLGEENLSRVLEAPVPESRYSARQLNAGMGLGGKSFGLPRFATGEFCSRFPFATIGLTDEALPLKVEIKGWSPFIPNDEDASSLPFAGIEYSFTNTCGHPLDAVYSFSAANFMKMDSHCGVRAVKNGFVFEQAENPDAPNLEGAFCARVRETAFIDTAWFRDSVHRYSILTMVWRNIARGQCRTLSHPDPENGQSKGATLSVPFKLAPGETRTIRLMLSWYAPVSDLRTGKDAESCCGSGDTASCCAADRTYRPWYTTLLHSIDDASRIWNERYEDLHSETERFTQCFYDSTLPEELLEAAAANLSILKSPTILRQTDGRIWGWEGCNDSRGSCEGSCTHVWNYAQSICHLFPRLEKSLRESEFFESQDKMSGHQQFRTPLPIRQAVHDFHAASDGQLGGIIKMYRDWRICGDIGWLEKFWPKVKQSLAYCTAQWDPRKEGVIRQPHHNTYDDEFWGPDSMSTTLYLGALKAASVMGSALGEENPEYTELFNKGRLTLETELFNGDYFYQHVQWKGGPELISVACDALEDPILLDAENSETLALIEKEGPKYQYGTGCLSDGVIGVWLSELSGLKDIADETKVRRHLQSVYANNFKKDLSRHANPQRPAFAMNREAGLLICTWPKGGRPAVPLVYCDEVFTGVEYQVASHMISKGLLKEGLDIVKGCRARYDGTVRNPYDEFECGHWYARAMASYALLQAYTGVRYDNISKTLYYNTFNNPSYRTFLSTATGYGTVEVSDGKADVHVVSGEIEICHICDQNSDE